MKNEKEKSNIIQFPVQKGMAERAPTSTEKEVQSWIRHHLHVVLAPHTTHIIVVGCIIVLTSAGLFGIHEGVIHHVAIAILAERISIIGLANKT